MYGVREKTSFKMIFVMYGAPGYGAPYEPTIKFIVN